MSNRIVMVLIAGVTIATLMTLGSAGDPYAPVMMGIILSCLGYLAVKSQSGTRNAQDLRRLQAAYEQLDQQAKLIIRTDLDLHRTQEELDRRLASLMALHDLAQQLRVGRRTEEVFAKLDARLVSVFGFSKGLLGMCPTPGALRWGSFVGISSQEAEALRADIIAGPLLRDVLEHPRPQTLSAAMTPDPAHQRLLKALGVPTAVVAGIVPQGGMPGCLILGRTGAGLAAARADEELVAILANQLATAIENSALFDETWTARQELERNVQERTRELGEANAKLVRFNNAKNDFVSAVSHELRAPLAAIKGYAALMARGQFGPLNPQQAERLAKIEKHSDALAQLINDVLDIARIESGRTPMASDFIRVEEFLAVLHELIQPQLAAKHLRYEVDRDGVTQLRGDAQQLQRAFVNLLSNAIKYTPDRGTIRVGLRREGTDIVASVSDTGCGIATEELPRLFQEFFRSNAAINQQVRGTGLGLALTKRIIEAHHGQITVSSVEGHGSTFTLRLPAPPTGEAPRPAARDRRGGQAGPERGP